MSWWLFFSLAFLPQSGADRSPKALPEAQVRRPAVKEACCAPARAVCPNRALEPSRYRQVYAYTPIGYVLEEGKDIPMCLFPAAVVTHATATLAAHHGHCLEQDGVEAVSYASGIQLTEQPSLPDPRLPRRTTPVA